MSPDRGEERDGGDEDVLGLHQDVLDVPGVVGDPRIRAWDVAEREEEGRLATNDAPSVMIRLASAVVRRLKPKARTARRLPATAARETATAPASQSGSHWRNRR